MGGTVLTNGIKTVKYRRMIFFRCECPARICELISDILNYCSYNTSTDDLSGDTDYILHCSDKMPELPDDVIADTAFVTSDNIGCISGIEFRRIVLGYEDVDESLEDNERILTFSEENYSADVTCRNINTQGDITVFDIVSGGILSRVRINSSIYSVSDVLVCTAVLIAAGIPIASITGYFKK